MLPMTHEQAIDQLRKVEQKWLPEEKEYWRLESVEQFVLCVKAILRAVPVKVLTAALLFSVLSVVPSAAQPAKPSQKSEKPPRLFYAVWAGLSLGAHVSSERDVRSTIRSRDYLHSQGRPVYEQFPFARPLLNDNARLRSAAHVGTFGVNVLSLYMLRSETFRGVAWLPQVLLIVGCNLAANRNGRLLPSPQINPLRGNGVRGGLPNVPGVAR